MPSQSKSKLNRQYVQLRHESLWAIGLLILLILLLLLWLAFAFHWIRWGGGQNLGSAFYSTGQKTSGGSNGTNGSNGSAGSSGSSGTNAGGSSGSGGSGGNGGGSTSPNAILTFAAGLNTGQTKEQVSGQASGLDQNCSVLVNSTTAGKQEVCAYTQGDKVVTVTFLNDHVISASRSGF